MAVEPDEAEGNRPITLGLHEELPERALMRNGRSERWIAL